MPSNGRPLEEEEKKKISKCSYEKKNFISAICVRLFWVDSE
jgi:hypothetical protein